MGAPFFLPMSSLGTWFNNSMGICVIVILCTREHEPFSILLPVSLNFFFNSKLCEVDIVLSILQVGYIKFEK